MNTFLIRVFCWLWLAPVVLLSSCASSRAYRQNIIFRTENSTSVDTSRVQSALRKLSQNYVIKPNDYLQVRVYTNKGERLIDPNGELRFGAPGSQTVAGAGTGGSSQSGGSTQGGDIGSRPAGDSEFLVQSDGVVKLPLVGYVKITGNTLIKADSLLQLRYNEYYKDSFVATRVTNSRVFVLGTPGGKVVPLYNDNMNLIEVLAAVGGIDGGTGGGGNVRYGKAFNIRLVRGDLKNPMVQVIDLSTIEGMRRADLRMQPNDIVYIEPVRRPFREALADITPVLQILTTALTTVLLVINLK